MGAIFFLELNTKKLRKKKHVNKMSNKTILIRMKKVKKIDKFTKNRKLKYFTHIMRHWKKVQFVASNTSEKIVIKKDSERRSL